MCHAVTELMDLEELRRLLALVDVFERLPSEELQALASGALLERLGACAAKTTLFYNGA